MKFSSDVLSYLAVLLSQQSVSASDPNFEVTAELVGRARRELLAALEASERAGEVTE
jgi:hypothetical protein